MTGSPQGSGPPRPAAAGRRPALAMVPNLVSALRLPLGVAFLAANAVLSRALLLFLAALTDLLDGWLARKLRLESRAGALIDPLFDKLFVLSALAAFLPGPYLGWRDFAILISRDLYVGLGLLFAKLIRVQLTPRSRPGGKLVTVLQIGTLFVLLLAPDRVGPLIVAVGVASIIAITDYTVAGIASLKKRRSVTTEGR